MQARRHTKRLCVCSPCCGTIKLQCCVTQHTLYPSPPSTFKRRCQILPVNISKAKWKFILPKWSYSCSGGNNLKSDALSLFAYCLYTFTLVIHARHCSLMQRRRNHGGAGGASPPENLTKGAGTFYYTAVQCSTARSVDLRVRASSRRVCARATLRVPAQHAWEGSCKISTKSLKQ